MGGHYVELDRNFEWNTVRPFGHIHLPERRKQALFL